MNLVFTHEPPQAIPLKSTKCSTHGLEEEEEGATSTKLDTRFLRPIISNLYMYKIFAGKKETVSKCLLVIET